jgi:hypothetical protein
VTEEKLKKANAMVASLIVHRLVNAAAMLSAGFTVLPSDDIASKSDEELAKIAGDNLEGKETN